MDARGNAYLGLLDYHARMYDDFLGRFTQADSVTSQELQNLNRHDYALNRPINLNDPTGRDPYWCEEEGSNANECYANYGWLSYGPETGIQEIAQIEGIHLAPGGRTWAYEPCIAHYAGQDCTDILGFTPANPKLLPASEESGTMELVQANTRFFDTNGNQHTADSTTSYITKAAFNNGSTDPAITNCDYRVDCIVVIVAHEAGHSWIQYDALESGPATHPVTAPSVSVEVMGQEAFVDSSLMTSPKISRYWKDNLLGPQVAMYKGPYETETGQNIDQVTQYSYGFQLTPDELLQQIFGQ